MSAKIVLRRYPATGPIIVAGMTFSNIDEIAQLQCIMVSASKAEAAKRGELITFSCRKDPMYREGWCTALIFERYPCFDIEDYATEDRYYNNYILHRGLISPQLCKKFLQRIPMKVNYCMATIEAPAEYLPIVYHDDGENFVIVAELAD